MALWCVPLSSFKEVVDLYNSVTPVVKRELCDRRSPRSMDIRPTNCRSRQHERIIKVNRNKYLLCDGHEDNLIFHIANECKTLEEFNKIMEIDAPIVWERKRCGSEVLTIRNVRDVAKWGRRPTGRMEFIYRHSPIRWSTQCKGGNQYLYTTVGVHVLPKNNFLPASMILEANASECGYIKPYAGKVQNKQDKKLVFTRTEKGGWIAPKKEYREKKWRIDTKRKNSYKPALNKFFEEAAPMALMFEHTFYNLPSHDEDIKRLAKRITPERSSHYSFTFSRLLAEPVTDPETVLSIMRNPDDECWIGLVKLFAHRIDDSDARKSFNRWVNELFGLKIKVEV